MLINSHLKIYVARDYADLRKSFQGLGMLVQHVLMLNPLSGHLFVFFNRRLDKVKILYWDSNGFCLWQKRLEKGTFPNWSFKETHLTIAYCDLILWLNGQAIKQPLPHTQQQAYFDNFVMS